MHEGVKLERKANLPTSDSTQGTFNTQKRLNEGFISTLTAPTTELLGDPTTGYVLKSTTALQAKAFSTGSRGHSFGQIAVFGGMATPQVEDGLARQAADQATEQELQSQGLAEIQAKTIQPSGFNFRQIPIFPLGQEHSVHFPASSIQRQVITEEDELETPSIQPKLTIGQPDDQYEQEADRVAAQVIVMPEPASPMLLQQKAEDSRGSEDNPKAIQAKPVAETITPLVQRQDEDEQDDIQRAIAPIVSESAETEVQTKFAACGQEEQVQRSPNGTVQAQPDLESRLNSTKGGGRPLPDEVRSFMEPRFGADFGQVRVHTDFSATQMNQELSAQAFTHGNNIFFSAGKAPGNNSLTAHELTHVVQQTGSQLHPMLQRDEVNDSAAASEQLVAIQGLPMYELLPALSKLSGEILNDEGMGRHVGGPRLVLAMQAAQAKRGGTIDNFLARNRSTIHEFEVTNPDQINNIRSFLGLHQKNYSSDDESLKQNSTPADTLDPDPDLSNDLENDTDSEEDANNEQQLTQLNSELATEIAKAAADIAGLVDPTPISDGISASISLAQGDYASAGLSLVAMIPYVGDAVGKPLKLARNAAKISKLEKEVLALTKAAKASGKGKVSKEIIESSVKVVKKHGWEFKKAKGRAKLRDMVDPNQPIEVRRWYEQEQRVRGNDPTKWRNPPGYDYGHDPQAPNDLDRLRLERAADNRSRGGRFKR